MISTLRLHWLRILLVSVVFAVFLINAVGPYTLIFDIGGGTPSVPSIIKSPEFVVLLVVGLVLCLLLPVLSPIKASALALAAMVPVIYMGFLVQPIRPLLPMEYSLLTILMLFSVNALSGYFGETHSRQQIMDAFGQYIPPEVVKIISRDPERISLAGEARELSVMFCDVHDFTTISEELGPRELSQLLNTLFTPLTRIIYAHGGTIDKYMGDAVMAFWGAPLFDRDHASKALEAAFEVQSTLKKLGPEFRQKGWPEVAMGVGINTGMMVVGNMGSEYRMAYTVVGDAVNLAARLEELTRVYDAEILVGENTRKAVPDMLYCELDLVQVKGKNVLTRIYEPVASLTDASSAQLDRVKRHQEAIEHYYRREWDRAETLFKALRDKNSKRTLYQMYLERIARFRGDPPPDGWEGEVRFAPRHFTSG